MGVAAPASVSTRKSETTRQAKKRQGKEERLFLHRQQKKRKERGGGELTKLAKGTVRITRPAIHQNLGPLLEKKKDKIRGTTVSSQK